MHERVSPASSVRRYVGLAAALLAALCAPSAHAGAPRAQGTAEPVSLFQAYPVKRVPGELVYAGRRRTKLAGAVAGAFDLATKPSPADADAVVLDEAAFATCPKGQRAPEVLDATLVKDVPGSALYPVPYAAATFTQHGASIRTHWTLLFDPPGTTFTLELQVRCTDTGGQPVEHQDRHVWKVDATFASLRALLDVLHAHPLGTAGIPAVVSERRFLALRGAIDEIEGLVELGFPTSARNAIADLQAQLQDDVATGSAGLVTTTENPAAEVLGVTLEYLDARL